MLPEEIIIRPVITDFPKIINILIYALTLSVTIIVVAVPEGLPMMITLVLSSNMKTMLKNNVLVRKLMGIETAGNINVLFTDKTGTLTNGKLEVVGILSSSLEEIDIRKLNSRMKELFMDSLSVNNESVYDTKNNKSGIFNICINYGGRSEIVDACKKITNKVLNNEISVEDINEDVFSDNLYNKLPDIDLLIRTSGEYRISNFMMWQLSYSEMYFTDTYFPDFKPSELDKAFINYSKRDRRYGGINNEKKSC